MKEKIYNFSFYERAMDFEIPNRAEALLIATVNPISKAEISKILGIEEKETARILRLLRKRYENTALELKMIGRKYKIGVRDSYSDIAFQYSESEIGKGELEIIGLVFRKGKTYFSHIERMRGKKAEEELEHLVKLGLVEVVPTGKRRIVKLTRLFFSRYGKELKEKVNLEKKVTP